MNGYTTNSGRIVIGRYDSAAVFHVEISLSEGRSSMCRDQTDRRESRHSWAK